MSTPRWSSYGSYPRDVRLNPQPCETPALIALMGTKQVELVVADRQDTLVLILSDTAPRYVYLAKAATYRELDQDFRPALRGLLKARIRQLQNALVDLDAGDLE